VFPERVFELTRRSSAKYRKDFACSAGEAITKEYLYSVTVGVHKTDTDFDAKWIAKKLLAVRLFESDEGKTWNKSAKDHGFGILAVSQFTLYAFLKVFRAHYCKMK